ncbi:hypothetical protein F5Y12DRAFT_25303 [Xylaria sp. FL1777]|nr:hypothetical protein F5Y12DRAFT_25303 [Xylaria sp. FL1777]
MAQPAFPWPFCQRPTTIAHYDDHRIRLSVATPNDLNDVADFCTDYAWAMKQFVCPEIIVAPEHMRALMTERYKASIKAIMDCCVPGRMTGIVFKIEYNNRIQGVMAINIVSSEFDDPWSQNERQEATRAEIGWIFPSDYLGKLAETLGEDDNHSQPILNVPYFLVSLEQPFLNVCLPSFRRLIETIATLYNRTAVLNLETGPYEHIFAPYLAGSSFIHTGRILENPSEVLQPWSTYSNYTHWTDPSNDMPGQYLDRIIRRALGEL